MYHSLCPIFSSSIPIFLKFFCLISLLIFATLTRQKSSYTIFMSFRLSDQINIILTIKFLTFKTRYSSSSAEAFKHNHHHKTKQSLLRANVIQGITSEHHSGVSACLTSHSVLFNLIRSWHVPRISAKLFLLTING